MAETTQLLSAAAARRPLFVGIDVGGTNTKIGIVDDSGRPVAYRSISTEQERGPADAAQRIGDAVHKLAAESGLEEGAIARAGLATPGPMDI
ncbi:MAG TPA: ROK family protein, partial [Lacipirellulaceae bacterium]|nr:ROK family protein [Lacipirellulaceae bacterium]